MAQKYLVDMRDIQFNLFEFLEIEKLSRYPQYEGFDRDIYEGTIRLAEKVAVEQIFPANVAGLLR